MALTQEDLNKIRDQFDQALEDAMSDPLSDLHELAAQVTWMRRDVDRWIENLKSHTKLVRSLVVKFDELRGTVKKLAK